MSSSPKAPPTIKATFFASILALGLVLALGQPGLQANGSISLRKGVAMQGKHHDGLMQILALTHAGMTTDEFAGRREGVARIEQASEIRQAL